MQRRTGFEGLKRSFDQDAFTWVRIPASGGRNEARISKRGYIDIPKHLAEIIEPYLIKGDDGFARVEIGYTAKSIAIRPLPPGIVGFKVTEKFKKPSDKGEKGYKIFMTSVIKAAGWKLPAVAYLEWDEENKMLAGLIEESK